MKMKIVQICDDWYSGGAAKVFADTVYVLGYEKDFDVIPVYAGKRNDCWANSFLLSEYDRKNKVFGLFEYIYSFANFRKLDDFLNRNKIDIVHIHGFYSKLSPSILSVLKKHKRKGNFKIVETVHSYSMVCPNGALYNYAKGSICEKCLCDKMRMHIFLQNCDRRGRLFSFIKGIRSFISYHLIGHERLIDKFIAPSDFLKNKLLQAGIDKNKITVMRNPCAFSVNEWGGIENKKNEIVYFGRFSAEKNLKLLIEAFARLIVDQDFNCYKLKFIGSGEEKLQMQKLVRRLHIEDKVIFLGFLAGKNLAKAVAPSKISVIPSKWYENAPLSIIESVMLNVIPVVSNIGGMNELHLLLGVGETFETQNVNDLVRKLRKIIKNYEEYSKKCKEKGILCREIFSKDKYSKELIQLYASLSGVKR
jgi:glycosyltransferase involved in cell wall biosynthesis